MPKYYYQQLIRKRLAWMLMYQNTGSVMKVCRHFGISRKCFYKWPWGATQPLGMTPTAFQIGSRRPKSFPQRTPKKAQASVVRLRRTPSFSPDRIRLFLLKDHNLSLPRATVYAILNIMVLLKGLKRDPGKPGVTRRLALDTYRWIQSSWEAIDHAAFARYSVHKTIPQGWNSLGSIRNALHQTP